VKEQERSRRTRKEGGEMKDICNRQKEGEQETHKNFLLYVLYM
jgi:hypothetical protein